MDTLTDPFSSRLEELQTQDAEDTQENVELDPFESRVKELQDGSEPTKEDTYISPFAGSKASLSTATLGFSEKIILTLIRPLGVETKLYLIV